MTPSTIHDDLLPPGLKLAKEIVTPDEEAQLIDLIERSGLEPFALDPTNPRSTRTFGWLYHNADDSISWGEPLPEGFHAVRNRAAALAGITPESLIECMLIRYEPGSIIQPHLDKPAWNHVIGISLGVPTTMMFRKPVDGDYVHAEAYLPPRSMYLLIGEARHAYQHSLPPVEEVRWSITFRDFSEEGMAMRDRILAET